MATASPALSNNSAETTSITASGSSSAARTAPAPSAASVAATGAAPATMSNSSINTSKNLRGLNKPKCIKCGNVARSRCPYQACKSCCAKAQNPCHIHVLKGNSSFPDKTPSSSSPLADQHSNETPSSGNSHRVNSLRQLSNSFAQFNNLHTPVRARKPLTRKEASQINEWRFSKLKEYKDQNIELENEAFDRYLQNIDLLEEIFANNLENKTQTVISKLKLKLKSDPTRAENFRNKTQVIINNGLKELKSEPPSGDEETDLTNPPKKARYLSLIDLNKKISNARTNEDLKTCRILKDQLFNRDEKSTESLGQQEVKPEHKLSKWFRTVKIDQEAVSHIDARFCGLEEIEQL